MCCVLLTPTYVHTCIYFYWGMQSSYSIIPTHMWTTNNSIRMMSSAQHATVHTPIQHGNTFCNDLFGSLTSWTMRFIWRVGPHWISKKHDQHSPPWVARPLGDSYQRVFNLHASLDWNVNTYEYSKPWLIHVNPLERWIDYRGKLSLQPNSTSHVSNHLEYFWAGT